MYCLMGKLVTGALYFNWHNSTADGVFMYAMNESEFSLKCIWKICTLNCRSKTNNVYHFPYEKFACQISHM